MDRMTLAAFENELASRIPGFTVEFKSQSKKQELIGDLAYIFNRRYMSSYTSTFHPKVWFPSKGFYDRSPTGSFSTLAHEYVHLLDHQRHGLWFVLSYAFPQVLAPLPVLAYMLIEWRHAYAMLPLLLVLLGLFLARRSIWLCYALMAVGGLGAAALAALMSGWWAVLLAGTVAALIPWPALWRTHWELRGYTMSLAVNYWLSGSIPVAKKDWVHAEFVGPSYYYMAWGKDGMWRKLSTAVAAIESDRILDDEPYGVVFRFLNSRGLVRRP